MTTVRRALLRLLAVFRGGRAEADLAREIEAHLQLLEDTFVARGLPADEARLAARRAFGGVEQAKEHQRDTRSFRWLDDSWLDLKLGARMLVKYPGLALVGGMGMAVAIAIGAGFFAVSYSYVYPTLPLDEGDRVVAIEHWDTGAQRQEFRSLHDFVLWRDQLRSLTDLGAFRTIRRNLIVPGGPAEPVTIAEMTASGFTLARVPALVGRPLVESDERADAPAVVVLGHEMWRTRFASDASVVGRDIRLGDTVHTVVGVMPERFTFPVTHRLWVPLRADPSEYERREGPAIRVFARLAHGATREQAHAELAAIGQRAAAAFPTTHEQLRPRLVPYTSIYGVISSGGMDGWQLQWQLHLMQFFVSLILVLVGANVAILVYARTATRLGELTVRTALGATRRRIVAQLFLEALVLAALAAAVGLLLAHIGVMHLSAALSDAGDLPFWIEPGLSAGVFVYAAGLAILAAVLAGVVPALQATGRRLRPALLHLGSSTGLHLGRTWTVLIVVQVALAVAVLPEIVFTGWEWVRAGLATPGFAAEKFLTSGVEMDREIPSRAGADAYEREFASRFGDHLTDLVRRLEAEPGVSHVTFASRLPGDEATARVEINHGAHLTPSSPGGSVADVLTADVRLLHVDAHFFDAFDVPLLTGRRLARRDADSGAAAGDAAAAGRGAIVNRAFVQRVLLDMNPLGLEVRLVGHDRESAPDRTVAGWHAIVGVVEDFPTHRLKPEATLYLPASPGQIHPVMLAVRMRAAAPATLADRLRNIATSLDPTVRVHEVLPLDEVYRQGEQRIVRLGVVTIAAVTLSVLLLSAAGIYALMSFTVARRRREIGIRAALGADPRHILASIVSRAFWQLASGVVIGLTAAALLETASDGGLMDGHARVVLPVVAAIVLTVGVLAACGPARRGLRVQPIDALREP
jgi:putative ABC transport system permease protein